MSERHWTRDEFIAGLYGIGREDGHPTGCERCAAEWKRFSERKAELQAEFAIPDAFLVTQRRQIRDRIRARELPRRQLRPISVAAAVLLLVVVLTVTDRPPGPPDIPTLTEAELFEEAFNLASRAEPSAFEPLHALFED